MEHKRRKPTKLPRRNRYRYSWDWGETKPEQESLGSFPPYMLDHSITVISGYSGPIRVLVSIASYETSSPRLVQLHLFVQQVYASTVSAWRCRFQYWLASAGTSIFTPVPKITHISMRLHFMKRSDRSASGLSRASLPHSLHRYCRHSISQIERFASGWKMLN